MAKRLRLALVGRPNVGKSALFNRICKKRIAIVDEAEGVTRDRLYADADIFGKQFEVIDTAGIRLRGDIPFREEVLRQTEIAIEEADVLVQVVDSIAGVTMLDEEVAKLLLKTKKPVVLAVNKIDDFCKLDLVHQFYSLGIGKIVGVSATQGFQIAELLEEAFKGVALPKEIEEYHSGIRVAILGRPNVGKSTLTNFLLKDQRCVVSPIAGTTRDSIDIPLQVDGNDFVLIDTAGIRRKQAEHEAVDKFAAVRTERALERADVCILVLDAEQGLTAHEKRIAHEIESLGKGCILLFNKWDLVKGFRMEHCLKSVQYEASFLTHCPTHFVSAKSGRNLDQLFKLIKEVYEQGHRRITTGQLNKFVEKVIQAYHPPMIKGRRLRIYYMAQVDVNPPHFVLFVNHPDLMVDTYKKYMMNQFREQYGFAGVPLIFSLKGRKTRQEHDSEPKAEKLSREPAKDAPLDFDEELTTEELAQLDPSYFA